MSTDQIGIVSNLQGEPYKLVKGFWNLFEKKFNSVAIQAYSHPHFTFQFARTHNVKELKKAFEKIALKIKSFPIEVDGIRRFDENAIYLKVEKTAGLLKIHRLIHGFLEDRCHGLLEYYTPELWVPHVTLAMEDLTKDNFRKAWAELKDTKLKFKQIVHNICMVKWLPDGKIRIAKRYEL
jgi:2'-5' RNA ligase